jgi:hypothetical protein
MRFAKFFGSGTNVTDAIFNVEADLCVKGTAVGTQAAKGEGLISVYINLGINGGQIELVETRVSGGKPTLSALSPPSRRQ